jgi:hypothetical protein
MILAEMDRRLQQEVLKLKVRTCFVYIDENILKYSPGRKRERAGQDGTVSSPNMLGDKQPSSPYAKPRSGTLCFDAIKKIKRTWGISHKARLYR